jgi:hypothetical protein
MREVPSARGQTRGPWQTAAAVALVGWLPLAVTAAVERLARGHVEPILTDLAVHARTLIASPVIALAVWLLDRLVRTQLERLVEDDFAPRGAIAALARRTQVWSHSPAVDLVLAVVAIGAGQLLFWRVLPRTGAFLGAASVERGPAMFLYAWLSFPLFAFVALRFVLHWLVWAVALFAISRQPLAIDAAHPDRAGGIGFLARPTDAFALFVFAPIAVASATWGTAVLTGRAEPAAFLQPYALMLGLALALAFLPLVPFATPLLRARRCGVRDYGQLAQVYVRRFRERWIVHPPGPELLGTADIQSLADLDQCVRAVRQVRPIPCELRDLLRVAIAALLPIVPLLLIHVPLSTLLPRALHLVVGGR